MKKTPTTTHLNDEHGKEGPTDEMKGITGQASDCRPEFASWDSYQKFAQHVRQAKRYVWDDEIRTFLDTVLATTDGRDGELREGQLFYRAQRGVDWCDKMDTDGNWIGEDVCGLGALRMKPLAGRAREGRANPTGIPVLYVGTTVPTVISEVRPWVGAEVSVAQCKLLKPLRTLDLSQGHGKSSLPRNFFGHVLNGENVAAHEKEKCVWIDIDNAFSKPVTQSDDHADYVPTQILAEMFHSAGYDAIAYKSHFGDDGQRLGYNIAIFDPSAVEIVSCAPYQVRTIYIEAEQIGNPWTSSPPKA